LHWVKSVCLTVIFFIVAISYSQNKNWIDGSLIEFINCGAWCWFQDERVIVDTTRERMIIGSTNMQASVDITIYDLKSREIESTKRFSRLTGGTDDHNAPAVLKTPDGRYLAMWAQHYDKYNTHYSIFDGSKWTGEKTFDWTKIPGGTDYSIAYCNISYLSSENRIYNFTRANHRAPNLMTSIDNGATWKFGGQLTTNQSKTYNKGYYKYWGNGKDRIDMVFTEQHPRDTTTSIYHGYIQNGKSYSTTGSTADENIFDTIDIPSYNAFTRVFKNGTVLDGISYVHCWQSDIMRYNDGAIAILFEARANDVINDHRNFYARYSGSEWKITYIGKAGGPMYPSEEDYTGLGALCPDDPDKIYISSPYDPGNDTCKPGKREIWRGSTTNSGATWKWESVTANSDEDNFRPVVPQWKKGKEALLWFRGEYDSAQSFTTKIVGLISEYTVGSKVTNTERGMPVPQLTLQPGRNGSVLVIGGTVSAGTAVTVQIFTMTGQLVKELRYTISSGETHNFRLDTGNLLTGSYFCRCDIGEYTVTKKFRL
jgi:hypothetical protein